MSYDVNVVYAANNKYAQYLCVTLSSLIEHSSDSRNYNIYIFETDISEKNKEYLKQIKGDRSNINLIFVNMDEELKKYGSEKLFCHLYFTKEMYLRIFIPKILENENRAIYIDIDTMVVGDVGELFDVDLEGNYIAACKDFNSIVNYKYFPNVKKYFSEILQLKDINRYFNSGVLLMDLEKLREFSIVEKTYDLLDKYKEFLYPDQDVLNLICEEHVKIIDNNWNFVPLINVALIQDEELEYVAKEWAVGLSGRKIIHYISEEKPWDIPERFYAAGWWKQAKKTPAYQDLLREYFTKHPENLQTNPQANKTTVV